MEALNPELVFTLRVASSMDAAIGIRQFELVHPEGDDLPRFTAGAHILIQAPNGVTRRYSLCNAPDDRQRYVLAVKREAIGRGGSISLVDDLGVGHPVHVSLPRNEFALNEKAARHLFIAGGIGITPIRSMVRHLACTGSRSFKLYYLTRSPEATAFRDELRAAEFADNVVIHHDEGNPDKAFDLWPLLEKPKGVHVYCCGPSALMESVRDMTGHWPTSSVHFEDFAVRDVPRHLDDKPVRVRIGIDAIDVPAGVSILQALRAKGYRVPSSCESGTCGSCRMRVRAGEPDHRDLVLTESERKHEMTVCVSRAHSSELVLEP